MKDNCEREYRSFHPAAAETNDRSDSEPRVSPEQNQENEAAIGSDEAEMRKFLVPDVQSLPVIPPSIVESNFVRYFAPDFMKPGHDQYIYRHPNGLCVIGLAPGHVALQAEGGVTSVDFNVGKADRSVKVTGKRKKNAQHFLANTVLCKVLCGDTPYVVRCCVKGSLLEVNHRLINNPGLLNSSADREGYIAITMPKPGDWLNIKETLLEFEDYRKLRKL